MVYKTAEAIGELMRNKIADKIKKPKNVSDTESSDTERTVIWTEKRQEILNSLRLI